MLARFARRRAPGVGRLGALNRRLLRAAHERVGLESRGPVASVHPTHGRRSGISGLEERARDSSGAAPARRSRASPILVCFLAYVL